MKYLVTNRIAGLTENNSPDGRVSHERAASPTATGLRAADEPGHDPFAELMAPTTDPRSDELFRRTRSALVDELRPATFSESFAVNSLARDYVQLGRVLGMIETLQRPRALSEANAKRLHVLDEARLDRGLVRELITRLDAGDPLAFTRKQAERLAAAIAVTVAQVRELVTASEDDMPLDPAIEAARERLGWDRVEPAPPDAHAAPPPGRAGEAGRADAPEPEQREGAAEANPGAVSDAADRFELQELERLKGAWALIRSVSKQLTDRDHLAAVFEGRPRLRARALKGLRAALAQMEDCFSRYGQWLEEERRGLEQRVERLQHLALAAVAAEPEKLLTLCRLKVELEKAAERKLQGLRSRSNSRDAEDGLGVALEATPAPDRVPPQRQRPAPRRRPRATPTKRR